MRVWRAIVRFCRNISGGVEALYVVNFIISVMARIGKYETIAQLGTGAMGTVYRARDTALGRDVALKTIRTGADVNLKVKERFYREARACARLQHPNIIVVYDLAEAENVAYIAMELLLGSDFRRIIQERKPLPLEVKIAAVAQVCEAVAYAHRHGVIHRDIKPSNLFLTEGGYAKVLDFGIARLPSSRLTVAGQILGTPNYMAPEQILSDPADGRADLFSVAVVFFELLTFAHPFQSSVIPRRIAQSEPDSLFDHDSSLPVILEKVMARGLAKDPNQRYQTGDEFAADLNAVLDALRQNAASSFSRLELPSNLSLRSCETITPGCTITRPVPEGQDAEEWRLSEALRLFPACEAMIEKQDPAKAKAIFVELESSVAGDIRFAEALRLCRSRIGHLEVKCAAEAAMQPARCQSKPEPSEGSLVDTAEVPVQVSGAQEPVRQTSVSAVDFDATALFSRTQTTEGHQHEQGVAALPPEELSETITLLSAGKRIGEQLPTETERTPMPQDGRTRATGPPVWAAKLIIIGAGIVVCALVVLMLAKIGAFRSVRIEPAVATATVQGITNIYAKASSSASVVGTVAGGALLNILSLPVSRDQAWTLAQAVKPKVLRPGYVQTAALRDWHGNNGPALLRLARVWGKGESGTKEEIEAQIRQLADIVSQFSSEPAGKDARLDIIRLRIGLARRLKAGGNPAAEWEMQLREAQQLLEPLRGEQNLQSAVAELDRQMNSLKSESSPVSAQHSPPARAEVPAAKTGTPRAHADVSALLDEAIQLRETGDYTGAEALIRKILQIDPNNPGARSLQDRISRGRDAEAK